MANYAPVGGVVNLGQMGRLVHGKVSRDPQIVTTKNGGFFVKFGVLAGVKKDSEDKVFVDCIAFDRGLAGYCKDLQKGDPVCCIGNLESREYNEKTFWNLNLSWCNSPAVAPDVAAYPVQDSSGEVNAPGGSGIQFEEPDDEDSGELPF